MIPTIDPTLAALYEAARESRAAWPILADWLEEQGRPDAAEVARSDSPLVAVRMFHGYCFGYFSAEDARRHGTAIWTTPDGGELGVTLACSTPQYAEREYSWPDKVYVGRIVEFRRKVGGRESFRMDTGRDYAVNFRPSGVMYINPS